jgi:hypothetical protein
MGAGLAQVGWQFNFITMISPEQKFLTMRTLKNRLPREHGFSERMIPRF